MEKLAGVIRVRTNHRCASLVVNYDAGKVSPDGIVKLAQKTATGGNGPAHLPSARAKPASCRQNGGCLQDGEHPLRRPVRRFLGLTAVGAMALWRTRVLGLGVAQGLLSPLGLVVLAASLPMLKEAWRQRKQGTLSLEGFLGGSIVLAAAMGEALTALEILWIDSGAGLLKAWIGERSRRAISDILAVTSRSTYLLVDGLEVEVPVDQVRQGDTVVLHTGEKVAVDGRVVKGQALVDESPINGRAEFIMRAKGDEVFAGTLVREGVIYVRAEKVGDETYLARVLAMVEDSLQNKAPIQGVADDLARKLIKLGGAATLATLLITRSFWRAFTVLLVMACPCATVLAASTAISAAISAAAKRRILIKGGRYLEQVGELDTACFDKTGTITTTHPAVEHITVLGEAGPEEMVYLAASAELHNSHPLARAVMDQAQRMGVEPGRHAVCEYFLGQGVRAELEGSQILVGSRGLMRRFAVSLKRAGQAISSLERQGLTPLLVARDGELLGCLGLAIPARAEAPWMLDQLSRRGVEHRVMITGDSQTSAQALCDQLDFDQCFYEVMPQEKARIVQGLREQGRGVMMVGDGINDALALAQADVGVAMGAGGAEVAIEAADIALVDDDLGGVVYVRGLSQATLQVVRQNFWLATGSNLAGMIAGALGVLNPIAAGLLHIGHTLGILANSSRLLAYDLPRPKGRLLEKGPDNAPPGQEE